MFFSEKQNQIRSFSRRSLLLLISKIGFLSIIGFKLFKIQVSESVKYKTLSENNRINLKIIPPIRGLIYDRRRNILATNYETYELFIIPEQVDDLGLLLKNLSKIVSIPFKQRKKAIILSKKVKKFEMIKVLDNLNWSQLEKIETHMIDFPGVHLLPSKKRYYPYNNYFSHVIGYTSQPSKEDLNIPYINLIPSLEIGKTGIEKIFNDTLIGTPGSREVEVNSIGREIREILKSESTAGEEVVLSLDLEIQKLIYKELQDIKSGSVVIMNVNTGEIIGMLSMPDFNPNKLINKPNEQYWSDILSNELSPLTNRVIQGTYAPGSTFKMVVALAALKKKVINLDSFIFCTGKIEFGGRFFHCWKTKGHGKVNLIKGIKESCDCFFYELAKRVGIDDIAKMSKIFGLGSLTNLELPSEKKGLVPNPKWKKEFLNENWYAGETLHTGIGQGYLLATPIQLVVMTSMIANDGKKIKPTLIRRNITNKENIKPLESLGIDNNNLKIIKQSMVKVVNEYSGTAYHVRTDGNKYIFAGKTGTSQVKRITLAERESEDFRKRELEWKNKDHALFLGYMPIQKPKYSICVVVEHGGSGSSTAAPIARKVFDKLYEMET